MSGKVIPGETAEAAKARLEGCPKCEKTLDRLTEPDGRHYVCGGCGTFFVYQEPMFFTGHDPLTSDPSGNA